MERAAGLSAATCEPDPQLLKSLTGLHLNDESFLYRQDLSQKLLHIILQLLLGIVHVSG